MDIAIILGMITGVIVIMASLIASFNEHDPDKWKHKGY